MPKVGPIVSSLPAGPEPPPVLRLRRALTFRPGYNIHFLSTSTANQTCPLACRISVILSAVPQPLIRLRRRRRRRLPQARLSLGLTSRSRLRRQALEAPLSLFRI